jgi:hypothetical protein
MLSNFIERIGTRGIEFSDDDREAFESHIKLVRSFISEPANDHSDQEGEPSGEGHSLTWLQERARMTNTIMEFVL